MIETNRISFGNRLKSISHNFDQNFDLRVAELSDN